LDVTDKVHSASEQALTLFIVQAMDKVGRVVSVGVTVPVNCTAACTYHWPTTSNF